MSKTITLEEHKIIGMIGKKLNDRLVKREVEICQKAKNKTEGRKLSLHWKKANKALSDFRNHMEEIMFIDFKEEELGSIYYGSRNNEESIANELKHLLKGVEK